MFGVCGGHGALSVCSVGWGSLMQKGPLSLPFCHLNYEALLEAWKGIFFNSVCHCCCKALSFLWRLHSWSVVEYCTVCSEFLPLTPKFPDFYTASGLSRYFLCALAVARQSDDAYSSHFVTVWDEFACVSVFFSPCPCQNSTYRSPMFSSCNQEVGVCRRSRILEFAPWR
jgi:hypothetical protein